MTVEEKVGNDGIGCSVLSRPKNNYEFKTYFCAARF